MKANAPLANNSCSRPMLYEKDPGSFEPDMIEKKMELKDVLSFVILVEVATEGIKFPLDACIRNKGVLIESVPLL